MRHSAYVRAGRHDLTLACDTSHRHVLAKMTSLSACDICHHYVLQTRHWCAHLNAMEQAARERRTTAGDESSRSWCSVLSTAVRAAKLGCARTAASNSSTSCLRTGTAGSVCSSVTSGRNSCNPMKLRMRTPFACLPRSLTYRGAVDVPFKPGHASHPRKSPGTAYDPAIWPQ